MNDNKFRNGSRYFLQVTQSDIGHWQPHKGRIGEEFTKQGNNQPISRRDKGRNKHVMILVSTAEAMEQWQTRFSAGLFGDILSIRQWVSQLIIMEFPCYPHSQRELEVPIDRNLLVQRGQYSNLDTGKKPGKKGLRFFTKNQIAILITLI